MIAKFLRLIGAVVAAIATALVLLIAVELFSAVVHPFPPDFKHTPEEMSAHVARYPQWVLAVVVPMWAATAFISTWIAGRLGNRGAAIFIAILLLAAVMCNLSMLPYPLWFKITQPIAIVLAIVAAYRATATRQELTTTDTTDTTKEDVESR
jgi:hypothetical protein